MFFLTSFFCFQHQPPNKGGFVRGNSWPGRLWEVDVAVGEIGRNREIVWSDSKGNCAQCSRLNSRKAKIVLIPDSRYKGNNTSSHFCEEWMSRGHWGPQSLRRIFFISLTLFEFKLCISKTRRINFTEFLVAFLWLWLGSLMELHSFVDFFKCLEMETEDAVIY